MTNTLKSLAERAYYLSQNISTQFSGLSWKSVPELTNKYAWAKTLEDGRTVEIKVLSEEYGYYFDKETTLPANDQTLPENKVKAKKCVWFRVRIWEETYILNTKEYMKLTIENAKNQKNICTIKLNWWGGPIQMRNEDEYAIYESI